MPPIEAAPRYCADPVPPYEERPALSLSPIGKTNTTSTLAVDQAVLNAIGDEKVLHVERYGNSAWAATMKLTTQKPNGQQHDYFLKLIRGALAGPRVRGEYACMAELAKTVPSLVPMPRAAGTCLDVNDNDDDDGGDGDGAAFFLCDYLEMDHRPANPVQLGRRIAELHRASVSPTGQFGFPITPYDGKLPLRADWDPNWTSFFTKLLQGVYQLDMQANGRWPELDDAMQLTLQTVIPRLLNRLVEDGRAIKPCLIHGDLHEQNIGTELRTGTLFVFDSCAYYAHHEMAMGMWRVDHHHMKAREYRREYFRHYPPDAPQEEADDRNRLYAVKEEIMYSAHVPGSKSRARALENLRFLIDKYVEYEDSSDEEEEDDDDDDDDDDDEEDDDDDDDGSEGSSDEGGSLMRRRS